MIEARGLTKDYGATRAVDALTVTVRPGIVTGFLGPNGAGKSTTMRLILGLDAPTAGEVTVKKKRYRAFGAPLHEVGAVLEARSVHGGRSAYNHLLALAQTHGIPKRRVRELVDLVGLHNVEQKRAGQFSLGMSQRLGIAAALLGDPATLLLDEPVNGLDPAGILEFRNLIRELVAEGRTVLLSSHLLDEVEKTCDVAAIVDKGHVIAQGPIADLVSTQTREIDIDAAPRVRAAGLLASVPTVARAAEHNGGIRVTLSPEAPVDREIVTELLGRLLADGIAVERVAPVTTSLEDLFLTMTTRLEDRA